MMYTKLFLFSLHPVISYWFYSFLLNYKILVFLIHNHSNHSESGFEEALVSGSAN